MANHSHILQVSELTKKVRFILESELNTVWLCGEISNFIAASSGHWYLSLKDTKSQVRCAMFKGNNRRVRIKPSNGQQVLVKAKVSLYEPRGDFQLIIEQMEEAGEGLLRQQFEQLKNKLNAIGLFDQNKKIPLPAKIATVGVVTSPTGAAIKDIISVMARRNALTNIIIYPALVQGELAAQDICQAINIANQRNECDVLIVGRGGGSTEDLWSFNEEIVVHAIAQSQLPVISAVGHEIDTTLADYAADIRAATPSAAAELVSQDQETLIYRLQQLTQRLNVKTKQMLGQHQKQHLHIQHRLQRLHPEQQLQVQQQRTDRLSNQLQQAFSHQFQLNKNKPVLLTQRLASQSPQQKVTLHKNKVTHLNKRLIQLTEQHLTNNKNQFVSIIEQLQLVSPLATIARGYSIVRDKNGDIIKHKTKLKLDQPIEIQLSDGSVKAKITHIE